MALADEFRKPTSLPPAWHTVQRGMRLLCISLIVLPVGSLGFVVIVSLDFVVVASPALLLFCGVIGLAYIAGIIQCAVVPDGRARGFMLGSLVGIGLQLLFAFAQVTGTKLQVPTTKFDLSHWYSAIAIHSLLAGLGFVLHLLYLRRLGQLLREPTVIADAAFALVFLLAWLAVIVAIVLADCMAEYISLNNRFQSIIMILNVFGAIGGIIAITILPTFCILSGLASAAIRKATNHDTPFISR